MLLTELIKNMGGLVKRHSVDQGMTLYGFGKGPIPRAVACLFSKTKLPKSATILDYTKEDLENGHGDVLQSYADVIGSVDEFTTVSVPVDTLMAALSAVASENVIVSINTKAHIVERPIDEKGKRGPDKSHSALVLEDTKSGDAIGVLGKETISKGVKVNLGIDSDEGDLLSDDDDGDLLV